eukprot:SAG11_NODE_35058_length_268_cov_1.224852_1_plen_23_part_10
MARVSWMIIVDPLASMPLQRFQI